MYANHVKQRITIAEVIENEWFKKGYKPPSFEQADISLADVDSIFNEIGVRSLFHLFFLGGWGFFGHIALICVFVLAVWTAFWRACCGEEGRRTCACGTCHYECI